MNSFWAHSHNINATRHVTTALYYCIWSSFSPCILHSLTSGKNNGQCLLFYQIFELNSTTKFKLWILINLWWHPNSLNLERKLKRVLQSRPQKLVHHWIYCRKRHRACDTRGLLYIMTKAWSKREFDFPFNSMMFSSPNPVINSKSGEVLLIEYMSSLVSRVFIHDLRTRDRRAIKISPINNKTNKRLMYSNSTACYGSCLLSHGKLLTFLLTFEPNLTEVQSLLYFHI